MKQYGSFFTDSAGFIDNERAINKLYYVFEKKFTHRMYQELEGKDKFKIFNRWGMSEHPKFVIMKKLDDKE